MTVAVSNNGFIREEVNRFKNAESAQEWASMAAGLYGAHVGELFLLDTYNGIGGVPTIGQIVTESTFTGDWAVVKITVPVAWADPYLQSEVGVR